MVDIVAVYRKARKKDALACSEREDCDNVAAGVMGEFRTKRIYTLYFHILEKTDHSKR